MIFIIIKNEGTVAIMQLEKSATNVGLVISLAGSLLTLPFNKKYHVAFGILLTLWSGIHSWQHRKSLQRNITKEVWGIRGLFTGCTNFFHQKTVISFLSQHVEVLHYVPGRVRLYSNQLLNNPDNARQVKEYLASVTDIHTFSVNPGTGSVLIQYSPDDVADNPLLIEVEKLVARQYRRR
ncbi:MAG: hypothetical protein K0R78_413 [Pelosinus sp.]|jgi:hypothetical protein|nr:hypothetical protein [Pelosinus sp.]